MKKYEDELCKKFWILIQDYIFAKKIKPYSIHHNNNGEHSGNKTQRSIAGKRAKDIGQIKGIFDYTAYTPSGKPIFIEFKCGKNSLTKEQKEFAEFQALIDNACFEIKAKTPLDFSTAIRRVEGILKTYGILKP